MQKIAYGTGSVLYSSLDRELAVACHDMILSTLNKAYNERPMITDKETENNDLRLKESAR